MAGACPMSMRDLLESRGRTVGAMREITDHPAGDGGDLSDDQSQKFDDLKAQLAATEKRIERQQLLDDAERRMAAPAIIHGNGRDGHFETARPRVLAGQGDPASARRRRGYRVRARNFRRGPPPRRPLVSPASRCPDEYFLERRVIDITPGGSPGAIAEPLYPTTLRPDLFIDRLRSALVVQRLGATVLDGLVGTVDIPRQVGSRHRAACRPRTARSPAPIPASTT